MKRIITMFLLVFMLAGMTTGCGGKNDDGNTNTNTDTNAENEDDTKKSDVVLTIGVNQTGASVEDLIKLGDKFKEETGIGIDIQVNPDDQWRDLLKAKLQAGEAPDVFLIDADPMSIYDRIRPEDNCIDFSEEEWVSRMDEEMLPSVSYKNKVYGMTFSAPKRWVFHYNKTIFEEAGITEIPTTYEEFKEACAKIIENTDAIPVFEATQNSWHQTLPLFETGGYMLKQDPELYEKLNKNEIKLSEIPLLKTIIEQTQELADLGYYGEDFLSESVDNAKDKIGTNKAAMYLSYVGWGVELFEDYPDQLDNIGVFMMPFGDSNVIGTNPANPSYFGNKNSDYVEEIKQFFAFLTRQDILDWNFNEISTGSFDFCWDINTDEERLPAEWKEYLDASENGTVMQYEVKYVDSQWMDIGKDLEALYTGAMSIDDVLSLMDSRRDEQAKLQSDEYWD